MAQVAVMERTATYTTLAPEARCLYDIYKKEGDVFYCRRKYKKALLSYNEALRLANHSAQTLVARSRCYMGIGMMAKALEDTEAALSISGTYLPAVYQKAQILYRQGNYEMALMMFNRGHKLNPSAPGFLEGVQKAQHAMDILASGRNMKTTVVGDLSFCIPKKNSSFHGSRRVLPGVGKSLDSSISNIHSHNKTSSSGDVRLPSPGFSKRHSMMLLNAKRRQPPVLSEASYGRESKRIGYLDDRAMREILGQLYDDKQYFERILNSGAAGNKSGDDLSGMLNSVLEDGLKFLYDRVLFWAQNGSLPPVAPPPAVVAKHFRHLQQQQQQKQQEKVPGLDAETNSGEQSDGEESEKELIKVNQAIDAVSSVNDPDAVASRKKKKLLVRKRRADILRKRASMVIVAKRKPKKSIPRDSKESLEEEPELMTPSRIQFHFNSLLPATGREERHDKQLQRDAHVRRSLPEGSKVSWEDDSATESGMVAVDDREEERQKRRAARKLRKHQQREAERKKQEEEKAKEGEEETKDEEPREDPLADYLNKVMNTMEELYQKGDLKALKLKAESFLLTMERYDPSIVGTKMAYVGRAHSYLGNSHLGLRHYDFALMHHEKDLEIGQRWKIPECQSRALGNIGRTHISTKKYSTALKYLAQKSKLVSEPRETAWLYHEIAGCFLQLHHYRFAQDAASKALAAATEAQDHLYLMQASVLQGAIQVKLQQYEKAYGSFEQAMEHAKLRDDRRAQQAITEALAEVNEKIAQQAKDLQNQEMSVIAAAEVAHKGEGQEEQASAATGDVAEAQQKAAEALVKLEEVSDEKKKEENDREKESERVEVEDDGRSDKKVKLVSAGSAANTGEDSELLALVSDDEGSTHANAENPQKDTHKQDENGEGDKEKDGDGKKSKKKTKEKEKEKQEEDKQAAKVIVDETNKNDNENNENSQKPSAEEDKSEQKIEEQAKQETVATKEETETNEEQKKKEEQSEADAKKEKKDADTRNVEEEKQQNVEEKEIKAKEDNSGVVVVVTETDNSRVTQEPSVKDEKDAKKDREGQTDKETGGNTKDELAANVGPDATYKGRPITAESLAKSMAKDKGVKHAPDQAVVTLNNTISREASRLYSADPSDNKADKRVTIAEVFSEEADKDKEKASEKEKRPTSPVEPRGKDPVTDKLEDDLKAMAQDFNDKEFDKVLKQGGEIMKTLKKVKNIDAWSKRRLRNFAKVHSYLGSASSEKQNFDKARQHHSADLKIGEAMGDTDIQSRSLEHLGRTFIFENKHEKALEYFAKRAHLPRDTEDTARLFHEIANCFFLLKAYEFAKDAAMVSLKAANEGGHTLFQLQSTVLIAVMKVKLNRVDTAFETFEEAMKFAVIRDDQEATEAIRGAMKQIEDRVAAKVRDKWLAKIGKKSSNAPPEAETSKSKMADGKETEDSVQQNDPLLPSLHGIIKSMKEEDKATDDNTTGGQEQTSRGVKRDGGSETHRTDKSDFLDAPEGVLEKKPSTAERIVKIELPEGESIYTATKRKAAPKKKVSPTPAAAKVYTIKKAKGKDDSPKNATAKVSNTNKASVKKSGENGVSKQYQPTNEIPKNAEANNEDDNQNKASAGPSKEVAGTAANADATLANEPGVGNTAPGAKPKDADVNKDEQITVMDTKANTEADKDDTKTDVEKTENETAAIDERNLDNNAHKDSEKIEASAQQNTETGAQTQPPKPKKSKPVKLAPGFYDKTYEEDIAHRMKLKAAFVAPKPKVKSKPTVSPEEEAEEEKAKQALMERRKSQRFIGLDPKKVAEAKTKPPPAVKEENPPPPKPKTERFVGLKIKPVSKSPKKENADGTHPETTDFNFKVNGPNEEANESVATGDETRKEQNDPTDRRESLMVPPLEAMTPSPKPHNVHRDDQDVGYDANMPSTPIMALNEDMPMIRKDSVGSRHSIQRPATRLSLAEMVRDDSEVTPKGASKAELSALNDLVQDSIRQEGRQQKASSPPRVVLKKVEPTFREKRLAEEKAAMERARRRRFLANQKASFILMLTSPYAEVPSLKNRRNSQWFPLLRRRTIAANMMAENSGFVGDQYQDDGSGSPRKYVRQSEKDVVPRKIPKRDSQMAPTAYGDEENVAQKHKLALVAKEMRRRERDERRDERKKLLDAEKKRRQLEREESELLKLTPRSHYPNPYNKPPSLIPGLEQHYVPSPEDDDAERQWRRDGERMLRREKLRAKREKEVQRLQKEEARKRKFEKQKKQRTGVSPREKTSPDKEEEEENTPDPGQMEEMTPDLSPNYMSEMDTESPLSPPRGDDDQGDDPGDDEAVDDNDNAAAEAAIPAQAHDDADQKEEEAKEKEKEGKADKKKKKKSKEKPEPVAKEDDKKKDVDEKEDKEKDVEEKPEEEVKPEEEEKNVDEEFDGYNDDDEDNEDEVAIHIEREARQMKEDYSKGHIDAVTQRGTDLLKSLRKHIDIVSWSRRRLRWFGVAHSYMGSALADKGEHDKAKSHHHADFRIGEALGEHSMQSRALEHLARISIAENQIPKALEYLAKRAHLPRDSETSSRLFLDMGNCFLQMGAIEFARDAAIQGLAAAKEGNHGTYQLQSSLLIAVCQAKLKDFDDAKNSFESALAEARTLNDTNTEAAIQDAIEQLEVKRATMVRDKWRGKKGGVEATPITDAIPEDAEGESAETAQA